MYKISYDRYNTYIDALENIIFVIGVLDIISNHFPIIYADRFELVFEMLHL